MKRIRSKLVLALLVVALIPVLPSYYMANGLVNHVLSLGFNDTVEGAIDGAVGIAAELHDRYETETIAAATRLASEARVQQVLEDPVEGTLDLSDLLTWSSYLIEIYDTQARLVASHSLESRAEATAPKTPAKHAEGVTVEYDSGAIVSLGDGMEDLLKRLLTIEDDVDPRFYRDSLAVLASLATVQVLSTDADPRLITVAAPVGEADLGFVVVTRLLPEPTGIATWQLSGLQELFQAADEHQADIRNLVRVVFWFFYAGVALFALLVGYLLSRRLTRPLLSLVDGTQRVASGDLDYRLDVASKDEIGQLMSSFNTMTTQIKVNQRLAAGREVQRQRMEDQHGERVKDLELAEMRERALQAENDRQTLELQKSQELERAYAELEASHQELQETQAQLILSEKMASLGALVAGVAHEINNPMGAAHSAVDVSERCADRVQKHLNEATSLDEARDATKRPMSMLRDNLGVIGQAAARIVTLVQGLKSFARIDEAQMQMADLHEGIDSTLVLLQSQIGPGVQIERESGEIPRTWCSPAQLNQVFMNVLTNAMTAVGEQGRITVGTAIVEDSIHVRIADDGVGMSAQQLEHIFDLQFRSGTARVKMGSGLSMAYRIMQENDGEILVDSQPGQGTQVTLRLPIRNERTETPETVE
ncbi:MAG: HAMP domain-containing protein [Gemmatimonadetes bacterium]|jgi:signal transduction histidine kinase|nr:HAMP domain-containing protein [Gemmatimonadota bacterium]MBT6145716.1 HAMP domain-containing protein [Gemmatimonadota bacterium]MBT7863328.1 HAMP domain-containing protein [Gemmatimonadota bacterium]